MKYDDIKKGKMYISHNKDNVGHPSLVVYKNKKNRNITIIKFTHDSKNKNVEKEPLIVSIYPDDSKKTYVIKFPYDVKSKYISKTRKFDNYKVNKKDKYRIDRIKRRKAK